MQTEVLERSVREALRETLDREHGPHAAWVGSPASRRVAELQRGGRWPLRALAVAAVIGTVAGATLLAGTLNQPTPTPATPSRAPSEAPGIFADIGGWIAYGGSNFSAIWAIDPAQPGDRDDRVMLSSKSGTPFAWSPDGSKLLVLRYQIDTEHPEQLTLVVLNADGTETRIAGAGQRSGAAFTPDGAHVVFGDGSNIYRIAAEGGTPELLLAADPRWWTLSPDGTQIAYLDWGRGDSEHSLRVMKTDGTGTRVVTEDPRIMGAGHIRGPSVAWSPDAKQIVFTTELDGVWIVGTDGSGLTQLASGAFEGSDPHWSPDGSLISYNYGPQLIIARPDGTRVQTSNDGRSGPWNPAGTQPATTPRPTPQPIGANHAALLAAFLEARVAGEGAERYIDGAEGAIPLLYATTSGASYERAEFEPVVGYEWPYGWTAFKVRLFAGDAVVEQLVFTTPKDQALIAYQGDGFRTDIPPTTEGGRPLVAVDDAFDGQVTLSYSHPWIARLLIPAGTPPTTDGGERNSWFPLVLIEDPVRLGTGCPVGPPPADAAALADVIQSDPGLDATAPIAVGAGGAEGLVMDVRLAPGARAACSTLMGDRRLPFTPSLSVATGSRMRLYLFDAPAGLSMRILVVGFVVPELQFERAAAAPISVQFHTP